MRYAGASGLLILLAACSGDDDSCGALSGVFLVDYRTISGDCGLGSWSQLIPYGSLAGPNDDNLACEPSESTSSANGCEEALQRTCVDRELGTRFVAIVTVRGKPDGKSFAGKMDMQIRELDGSQCRSLIDFAGKKQ